MDINRFKTILETYGADPRRWPMAERDTAQSLLTQSGEARAMLEAEQAFDALLDQWIAPAPDPWAAQRIAAQAEALPQQGWRLRERMSGLLPAPLWSQLAGLAAALLIGLTIGFSGFGASDASAAWPEPDYDISEWETSL